MILYPAIDLMNGEVVRLVEGDFERKTIFLRTPEIWAQSFSQAGAKHLHVVDLSGARDPEKRQTQLIGKLIASPETKGLKIQVGGGVRTLTDIQSILEAGADRVVLGSVIITDPSLAQKALQEFGPDRLTFALDVRVENREPMVMTHGWTRSSGLSFSQALQPFMNQGLTRVLCTDIATDGKLAGPNTDLYARLAKDFPHLEIQASGGVSSLSDIVALKKTGIHSAIVGRAILTGAIRLEEALKNAH